MNRLFRWHRKDNFVSRLRFMAVLILGAGIAVFVGYTQQPAQPPDSLAGGGVHGSVDVLVKGQMATKPFETKTGHLLNLPDFELFLQNAVTGDQSQPVKSDLFGRFMFATQKAGTYELRWKQQSGWQEGVLGKNVVIANGTAYVGSVEVSPQDGGGTLVGQVKRADGGSPWFYDEFFEINRTAQVEALDGSGNRVAEPVRTNAAGEFAIAGLPKVPLEVRATSEAAVVTQTVPASALSFTGPVSPVTLTFSQSRPQILSVAVTEGQKAVRSVTPGATVTVTVNARGSDQNGLKFDWRLQKGMGTLNPAGASADWTLPAYPGVYTAYVMVSDGFGGYATRGVSVLVGDAEEASVGQSAAGNGTPEASGAAAAKANSSSMVGTEASEAATLSTSATACLNVIVASALVNPRLTVTNSTGTFTLSVPLNQAVVVVSGLPPNTDLTLGVLSGGGQLRPDPDVTFETAPLSPLPDNIINTGMPGNCQTVRLTGYPAPNSQSFLTHIRPPDSPPNPSADMIATAYYNLVDPQRLRQDLGHWWTVNKFDQSGAAPGEVRTSYLNNNDLGSGRDMHFLRHADGTVSAYVTNYLDVDTSFHFNQNPAYADSAAAQDQTRRQASVCMEWSQVEGAGSTRIVKFFVYQGNGNGANAPRVTSVVLDETGSPKYVPYLCLNCHGGSYLPSNPLAPSLTDLSTPNASSFREFDLATFKYPGGRDVPNDAERAAFKQQNLIVRGNLGDPANPISTQAIKDLVNGWYSIDSSTYIDPHPKFTGQNTNWNPLGWADPSPPPVSYTQSPHYLYHNVVAKSCRTCHVAFGDGTGSSGQIDWTSFQQFITFKTTILGDVQNSLLMPHSQVTYKNFWNSRNPSEAGVMSSAGF